MALWIVWRRGPFTIETRLASADPIGVNRYLRPGGVVYPLRALEAAGWHKLLADPWVEADEIEAIRQAEEGRFRPKD